MNGDQVYRGELIGAPVQVGFMLLDVIEYPSGGTFEKADYPALRAIRIDGGELTLAVDLADSENIGTGSTVEAYC